MPRALQTRACATLEYVASRLDLELPSDTFAPRAERSDGIDIKGRRIERRTLARIGCRARS